MENMIRFRQYITYLMHVRVLRQLIRFLFGCGIRVFLSEVKWQQSSMSIHFTCSATTTKMQRCNCTRIPCQCVRGNREPASGSDPVQWMSDLVYHGQRSITDRESGLFQDDRLCWQDAGVQTIVWKVIRWNNTSF